MKTSKCHLLTIDNENKLISKILSKLREKVKNLKKKKMIINFIQTRTKAKIIT